MVAAVVEGHDTRTALDSLYVTCPESCEVVTAQVATFNHLPIHSPNAESSSMSSPQYVTGNLHTVILT